MSCTVYLKNKMCVILNLCLCSTLDTESLVGLCKQIQSELVTQVLSITLLGHWLFSSVTCLNYLECPFPSALLPISLTVWYYEYSWQPRQTFLQIWSLWFSYSVGEKGLRRSLGDTFLSSFVVIPLRNQRKAERFMGSSALILAVSHTRPALPVLANKQSGHLRHSSRSASPISTKDIWTGCCLSSYNVTICSGAWA